MFSLYGGAITRATAMLKTSFSLLSKTSAFFTSGAVKGSNPLYFQCGNAIKRLDVETDQLLATIGEEKRNDDDNDAGDSIVCFAPSPDNRFLLTGWSRSRLIDQWELGGPSPPPSPPSRPNRTFKGEHSSPPSQMVFDASSTLVAIGFSNGTIKIWDATRSYWTHNFRGRTTGVVQILKFHPDTSVGQLYAASSGDCVIRAFDLKKSRCTSELIGHSSPVTGIDFIDSNVISCGRDKIVNVWEGGTPSRTIPVFEELENIAALSDEEMKSMKCPGSSKLKSKSNEVFFFITVGRKGILKVWQSDGKCLHSQSAMLADSFLSQVFILPSCRLATVTSDHHVLIWEFSHDKFQLKKRFIGHSDEILDVKCINGPAESRDVVVASNSADVKIQSVGSVKCSQILSGHTDIVLCVDVSKDGRLIATGAKDSTIRLWSKMKAEEEDDIFTCVGVGKGHTGPVGTVALSIANRSSSYVISGSQDSTIKVWDIRYDAQDSLPRDLHPLLTQKAHDKDINAVAVSPNNKLLASGSQDKTAKIWTLPVLSGRDGDEMSLHSVLSGHKKGVWCVAFSPVDRCLATCSGDGLIKIWAISDGTCVTTLEGHPGASVLRIIFISHGMQMLSSASDGLIKLWNIKKGLTAATLDGHADRVWAICLDANEMTLVSGGADSTLVTWSDCSEEIKEKERAALEEEVLMGQRLANMIQSNKYEEAVDLALALNQPQRLYDVFGRLIESGGERIEPVVNRLRRDRLETLVNFIVAWNSSARTCWIAHRVLHAILKHCRPDELASFAGMQKSVEGLISYGERHLARMNRLQVSSEFVEYTWEAMRGSVASLAPIEKAGGVQKKPEKKKATARPRDDFFIDVEPTAEVYSDEDKDEVEEKEEEKENDKQEKEMQKNTKKRRGPPAKGSATPSKKRRSSSRYK